MRLVYNTKIPRLLHATFHIQTVMGNSSYFEKKRKINYFKLTFKEEKRKKIRLKTRNTNS
jgi:hypothetical protein